MRWVSVIDAEARIDQIEDSKSVSTTLDMTNGVD